MCVAVLNVRTRTSFVDLSMLLMLKNRSLTLIFLLATHKTHLQVPQSFY